MHVLLFVYPYIKNRVFKICIQTTLFSEKEFKGVSLPFAVPLSRIGMHNIF